MTKPLVSAATLIKTDANACYEAFADPTQMCRFWFPRSSGRLETGARVSWFLSDASDAIEIPVRVISAVSGTEIVLDWGDPDAPTRVTFKFEDRDGQTEIRITETGHAGSGDEKLATVLDSQGGFNQLVTAAKAWLEHGVAVDIVSAHVT